MNGFEMAGYLVASAVILYVFAIGPYYESQQQKRRLQALIIIGCPLAFVLMSIGFML